MLADLGKSVSWWTTEKYDSIRFKFIYGLWVVEFVSVFLEQYITRTFLTNRQA